VSGSFGVLTCRSTSRTATPITTAIPERTLSSRVSNPSRDQLAELKIEDLPVTL
jgi:hypothetical protein